MKKKKVQIEQKETSKKLLKKSFINYLIYFPRIIFAVFILFIIVSPLLIISGSKSFYQNNINEECFEMISEKDCRDLQMNAFNFLNSDEELDDRYSMQEKSHFDDVKKILDIARVLIITLLIFVLLYFAVLFIFEKTEIFKTLKLAGIISASVVILILIGIAISFQATLFLFHALIFPQGNWTFPFDNTIIIVFSEQFFIHAAVVSFVISLGISLLILGLGIILNKKFEQRVNNK